MNVSHVKSTLLRRALQANGVFSVFSVLSGIVLILEAEPLSTLLGLNTPKILIGVGASLLLYAAALFRNAFRTSINSTEAWMAMILDLTWVAGSVVVILVGLLTTIGNWVVASVADIVLLFGLLQFYGIRKLQQEKAG